MVTSTRSRARPVLLALCLLALLALVSTTRTAAADSTGQTSAIFREDASSSVARAVGAQDELHEFVGVLHNRGDTQRRAVRLADPAEENVENTTTTTTTTVDPSKPWQSVPPTDGYPEGSSTYTRRTPQEVKTAFFTKCWYVAIIILVLGVALLYIFLCIWICCHFEKSEQNRAKKVVQRSYEENGYFDLSGTGSSNSFGSRGSSSSASANTRSRGSGTYAMDMTNNMIYRDADDVSVGGHQNPLNGDDYYE